MKSALKYLALALLLVSPALAQDGPQTDPPVSQAQLDLFLGSWSGHGSYESDGNKIEFKLGFTGKSIVLGKAIEIDPSAEVKGMGPYREKSIFAWDPMQKHVAMMSVSNFGEVGMYTGDWEVGQKNTLKLKGTVIVDNDRFEVEHTLIFHDGNQLHWRSLSTKNGGAMGTFEARLKRK